LMITVRLHPFIILGGFIILVILWVSGYSYTVVTPPRTTR